MSKPVFIQENISLAPFSTFKIGGSARYFLKAKRVEELIAALAWSKEEKIPFFVLGGGSNILIHDDGFNGLVIKIDFNEVRLVGDVLEVGAGVLVIPLAHKLTKEGWRGLEWAGGLPGSFGGALRGNAGAFRSEISEQTMSVTVFHKGQVEELKPESCAFAYRTSIFKTKRADDIIIKMRLQLKKGDSKEAWAQLQGWLDHRHSHQPGSPSAGCTFKNYLIEREKEFDRIDKIKPVPPEYREYKKIPAAWLIEQSGLKGLRVGGAEVSGKHASFITNTAEARAVDVWELMRQVKQQVYNTFNVVLEEEVQLVGFEGSPPLVR
ncbi:MAG: UDP-N-acetylenolpyruvoylglucosamine reductase [Candidatus Magasanikbacteria bacterium GW2011_GWC2_45_8]|uniref:UDP-N-acetylenolpyruvoylglucosamine reductase n=1 Tax=Candidatus Magasanikbacteria bacterium GW2011_GWC2_45_8 TaxID=1619050 RepID=A0A0G1MZM5_9BACT|nr:MAG: UDP-N-acetylenolpyruvoylglucosamine reductase [Candidatus Magasanikbacteria bacterium GW2011_GWC2_45_8]